MPVGQLLVAFATNCVVALLNAYCLRRLIGGPPWFGTLHAASIYIVIAAGVGPAIAALGGALVPIIGGGAMSDYWIFWSHWYLSNALPNLTIGPVFLIWFADEARWSRWRLSRRQIEPALFAVTLIGCCILAAEFVNRVGDGSFRAAVLLMPLPWVLCAALRYGDKGASGAILIVAVIFTWRTLRVPSLFPGEDPTRSVLALQLFLMALSLPVLLLGALIDELRHTERSMRALAAAVLGAQDQERRRIARDLHDSTGQNLIAGTLIVRQMQDLMPQSAAQLMQQLNEVLDQSIREVRTVSYLLHPPMLDEAGLGTALRCYVDGYSERSGLDVDLDVAPNFGRLDPDTELVLFRIVQEALTNVSRHSHSDTAFIRLMRRHSARGEQIELVIEDEGRGIPQTKITGLLGLRGRRNIREGIGLTSMRERLQQIGGRLDIESKPGRTRVRAIIPQ
jgi:signal transduction histidine kinase